MRARLIAVVDKRVQNLKCIPTVKINHLVHHNLIFHSQLSLRLALLRLNNFNYFSRIESHGPNVVREPQIITFAQ